MDTYSRVSDPTALHRVVAIVSGLGLGIGGLGLGVVLLMIATLLIALAGVEFSPVLALVLSLLFIQGIGCIVVGVAYVRYRERLSGFANSLFGSDSEPRPFFLGLSKPGLFDLAVALGAYALALVGAFVGALLVSVLVEVTGEETGQNAAADLGLQQPELLLLLVPISIFVVGPGEELLFRGVVQGRLREVFSPVVAIVIAGTVFALIHFFALTGGTAFGNLIAVTVLVIPSFIFGASYELTDNIVVPSLAHGLYNATLFTLLYVVVRYGPELEEMAEQGAVLAASLPV